MSSENSLPLLNRSIRFRESARVVSTPDDAHFELPERVLQFGTGAFLRGFTEYFIDESNRSGRLGGRVVLVSSTGSGRASTLTAQDNLYSLVTRGLEDGKEVDHVRVLPVISRAISAKQDWGSILEAGTSPALKYIVSNTTEVGITLDLDDRIDLSPPRSFPGKLAAVLYHRAEHFDYAEDAGLVILPCELIEENGAELKRIVLRLASEWSLGERFAGWVQSANVFCNTLVDRIVPGTPPPDTLALLQRKLGYRDEMLTVTEPYRLWAIEADAASRNRLELLAADPGVLLVDDIAPYRTRKVRILNGGHTISVPAAWLCGCKTVQEAVEDPDVGSFLRHVIHEEIVPVLDLDGDMAESFARDVLERFGNPFIRHELLDITFQQTTKLRVRVVPTLLDWYRMHGRVPESMAFGFACFLVFQHPDYIPDAERLPVDGAREWWNDKWSGVDIENREATRTFVDDVLSDTNRWGTSLSRLNGFSEAVEAHTWRILRHGARTALQACQEAVS